MCSSWSAYRTSTALATWLSPWVRLWLGVQILSSFFCKACFACTMCVLNACLACRHGAFCISRLAPYPHECLQSQPVARLIRQLFAGYFDTLMSVSAASTSSELAATELSAAGISPGALRMSVGLTGKWAVMRTLCCAAAYAVIQLRA
jgi:hypothetical protein